MDKKWIIAPQIEAAAEQELVSYPPLLRQLLYNRGKRTAAEAETYLTARPPQGTDPLGIKGMAVAVERIRRAVQDGEKIVVYGDYDADGVTATALLVGVLEELGGEVRGYIPNRFDEGYGLNREALDQVFAEGARLVVTVDCGIRAFEEAEHAAAIGLDMIISDHHHPRGDIPPAVAILNPKQPGDTYPEKELAGVGLAYKLAVALLEDGSAEKYLDLVALGTVADLAPLVGENRALVRAGLQYLNPPHRQGIASLINVSGLYQKTIEATHIGYILGPRLNAAGRLESAYDSLNLLLNQDATVTGDLAQKLDNTNRERQELTRQIQEQAEAIALALDPEALLLFAVHPEFNAGVVGLAASRLTEQYYRPAIVGQVGPETTRASCRSIAEFHITEALDTCADLLDHHGGHAAAAGFTVRNDYLDELLTRLNAIATDKLGALDLRPSLKADLEIPLSELKPDLLGLIGLLQPTGVGNPGVQFVSRGLRVKRASPVGHEGKHLRLTVTDGNITYDAIAFGQGHWMAEMPASVDLMYAYEVNEYNGRRSLQLNVRDIKVSR